MIDRPTASAPPARRRPADRLHLSPRRRAQIEALLREHLPDVDVWAYQPVVKVGVFEIDTTVLLLYTGGHVDGDNA